MLAISGSLREGSSKYCFATGSDRHQTALSLTNLILKRIRIDASLSRDYNVITFRFGTHPDMGAAIRTRIVKIGNSQGIRIPKLLLEQSGVHAEVEIEVQGDHLIIRPAPRSREGWDDAFADMATQRDDALLDEVSVTDWDQTEWQW